MSTTPLHHPASYRDPSGFIFEREGILYRQINNLYKEHYDHFISSGCYEHFVEKKWLIPHEEVQVPGTHAVDSYKTIRPQRIPIISYPSEWSFDMLKDAALLTLQLTKESLRFGMILKDATPLNIQWHKGHLIFIDTLSFEKYEEHPWIAYRQFCETFLGPLLLMHYKKYHLPQLSAGWPNGMPVQLIQSLLPFRSRFSLSVYLHIHLHARYAAKGANDSGSLPNFSRNKLLRLLDSLETLIRGLKTPVGTTDWSGYYKEAADRNDYLPQKKNIIAGWLKELPNIKTAADLGANEGEFSQLLAEENIHTLAADSDAQSINQLYKKIKQEKLQNIQPLVIDLSTPTPAGGVNNVEYTSFIQRGKSELVLALALIHHLSITKNIPFEMSARFLSSMGEYLIIEFVPKEDTKVKMMLAQKKDIYTWYDEDLFVKAYASFYSLQDKKQIGETNRVLYLFKKSDPLVVH